jgi:DNA-binding GntR family transcriptional regulator
MMALIDPPAMTSRRRAKSRPTARPQPRQAHNIRRGRQFFSERAYRELRARILDNSMPCGEQFTEETLAAMLKMSRTPVREAMLRLESEGLVEVRPRHGMRIKPVSVTDIREIYEVLTGLESTAAALAARRQDQEGFVERLRATIAEMDRALERDDRRDWAAADERFHTLLVEAAGNSRITELVQTFFHQSHRVRMLTLFLRPVPIDSNREHEAVVDAVAAHDAERAREIHCAHRQQSGEMLVDLLIRHGMTQL